MKIVTITNPINANCTISMVARYEKTRNGFKHEAETTDGVTAKACYLNRTWEVYTYQTVLHQLAYNWIVRHTGWNPKTKRDGVKFNEMWTKMNTEIDSNRNWA